MLNAYQLLKFGTSFERAPPPAPTAPDCPDWEAPFQSAIQFVADYRRDHGDRATNRHCQEMLLMMKRRRVQCVGEGVRAPLHSLEVMAALCATPTAAIAALRETFGVKALTVPQRFGIPQIYSQRNVVLIAPTGSGKTLAYAVPVLDRLRGGGHALIVCPTFELSLQTYQVAARLSARGQFGVAVAHLHAPSKAAMLIATPERALRFLQSEEGKEWARALDCVVLDEADRFFELNFMELLEKLLEALGERARQWVLCSATLPLPVEAAVQRMFADCVQIIVNGKLSVLPKVDQRLVFCSTEEGKLLELEGLAVEGQLRFPCMIFTQTRQRARQLCAALQRLGIPTDEMDGGLSLEERRARIEAFRRGERVAMVSTDLLARGIDISGLRMVISFDVAPSCVAHVHRVGRTARGDGGGGSALTFFTPSDRPIVRKIAEMMARSGCEVPEWLMKLKLPSRDRLKRFQRNAARRPPIEIRRKANAETVAAAVSPSKRLRKLCKMVGFARALGER